MEVGVTTTHSPALEQQDIDLALDLVRVVEWARVACGQIPVRLKMLLRRLRRLEMVETPFGCGMEWRQNTSHTSLPDLTRDRGMTVVLRLDEKRDGHVRIVARPHEGADHWERDGHGERRGERNA